MVEQTINPEPSHLKPVGKGEPSHPSYRAAIALGSNLGDSAAILRGALQSLKQIPDIKVEHYSHIYRTVAVGPPQPDYLNACALISTRLWPGPLLDALLHIEAHFGRERRERWGPRHLDLDLLLYENWVLDHPGLQVPHPRMRERAFVLVPLAEIAPTWIDPVSGWAIADLLQTVDPHGVTPLEPMF